MSDKRDGAEGRSGRLGKPDGQKLHGIPRGDKRDFVSPDPRGFPLGRVRSRRSIGANPAAAGYLVSEYAEPRSFRPFPAG
ncbi:MAG: hypothetical protein KDN05_19800, partial [Verrucomicrobiae bacterium]|nr:hypothetical protein [Verrucomicrobiae bacterium]